MDVVFIEKRLAESLPTRGAWIEIVPKQTGRGLYASLPTRGAWIEIQAEVCIMIDYVEVAPHTGSVD